ncbi:MAG: hypothetical protein EOP07_14030 [Proteobacteria bacterium]|nr:MAG: hypothetical protein EOP07_14030 [Pseudomonadota bacterium]
MSNIKNDTGKRDADLNQKSIQSGRNSDKVDQEGKDDASTSINQSYNTERPTAYRKYVSR